MNTRTPAEDLERPDEQESRAHLWELIKDIRFAMFTTRHANGHLHARPMTTQNSRLDEDSSLWFFMARGDEPVADLQANPAVNIAYAHPGKDSYVSVSGEAFVVEDLERKRQLWTRGAEAWFPGGPEDPSLALVEVRILHATYWDVQDSKVLQLFKMARSVMTGEQPRNLGETAEVRMR